MEPITLKVNQTTLEKMKKYYDSQMVSVEELDLYFQANAIGCVISADSEGRVTFDGQNCIEEAKRWSKRIAQELDKLTHTHDLYKLQHIGTAETGSADYLGPICVVSCYLRPEDIEFIDSLHIKPLAELTNQDVIAYAKEIKDKIVYSLLILDNSHYNKMVQEGFNQANIKARLMNQATVNVMQKAKENTKVKVINQFVSPKTYFNYLKSEVIVVKDLMFETNASDKYMAVLASEILSRYAYLQYFANMTKSLKMNLSRGTSTSVDTVAAKVAAKYGEKMLTKVAKLNFSNTKRVKALLDDA